MRPFAGLTVTLGIAGAFLICASAFSMAQQGGGATTTVTIQVAPAQKAVEAAKGGGGNNAAGKRPPIKFKVFDKAEVKKAAVAKRAVRNVQAIQVFAGGGMVQAVADGEPNPQLLQEYRPMFWAEYHLARNACNPTPEQRKAIARDAEHAFQEVIAKSGLNPQLRRRIRVMGANQRNEPDDSIRETVVNAIKAHLDPAQLAKYQQASDMRTIQRKRITVDSITAKMDESLYLTSEQRDKIRAAMFVNWKDSWCPSPEALLMNGQMLPMIPDPLIVPFLNEAQKSIWRGLSKFSGNNFRYFGFIATNLQNGDNSPEDVPLREAREAETTARDAARIKREAEARLKAAAEADVKKRETAKKK